MRCFSENLSVSDSVVAPFVEEGMCLFSGWPQVFMNSFSDICRLLNTHNELSTELVTAHTNIPR